MEKYIFQKAKKQQYLVIYDICNDKRRRRVFKVLESYGFRVQESAFEMFISHQQKNTMMDELNRIIGSEDNLRIYKLHNAELDKNNVAIYDLLII